jgi:hypothetical protein
MKKSFFVIAIAMIMSFVGKAQSTKSVYFELFGPGLAAFNFDTRLSGKIPGLVDG